MGEVEEKAGAEAEKKGITGKARRDYIGGAFHRIMAHHASKVKEQKEKREAAAKKPKRATPRQKAVHHAVELLRTGDTFNEKRISDATFLGEQTIAGKRLTQRQRENMYTEVKQKAEEQRQKDKRERRKAENEREYQETLAVLAEEKAKREASAAKSKTQLEYEKFLESKKAREPEIIAHAAQRQETERKALEDRLHTEVERLETTKRRLNDELKSIHGHLPLSKQYNKIAAVDRDIEELYQAYRAKTQNLSRPSQGNMTPNGLDLGHGRFEK